MRGLDGRCVLISGGTRGIGRAAARRFLEEGARVFVGGRDDAELGDTLAELSPLGAIDGLAGDVASEDHVEALVGSAETALGGLDVLIGNAGIARKEPFLAITPEAWDRVIAVNLRGMFLVAQAAARRMIPRGAGSIVLMASTNGLGGEEDFAHYNASKGPGELRVPGVHRHTAEHGPRGRGHDARVRAHERSAGQTGPRRGGRRRVRVPRQRRGVVRARSDPGRRRRPDRGDVR